MNVFLWVAAGVLAVLFASVGIGKLTQSKEKLMAQPNLAWTEDFSPGMIKLIAAAELAAGLGLVLPPLTGIAPVLTPLAASGLVIVMAGAAVTHARRGEARVIPVNVVLGVLALVVAWGRFGPYAF